MSGFAGSNNCLGMGTEAGVVDRDAFASFYREHYTGLVGFFFRRVADRELARDLTAEAFRITWSKSDAGTELSRAFLFGVARNLVGDEWRRRARTGVMEELPDELQTPDRHDATDVRLVLAALPAAERDVLVLTYWDGWSAAEVAAVLGISRANVWTRLHRARRAFADAWHGTAPPPVTAAAPTTRTRPVKESS
jgi:RNA polymerase sigma factor (sigma-70 family)